MAEPSRFFTIRPLSKPARTDLKDALRVHVTPATLLLYKLKIGDVLFLEQAGKADVPGIAWAATEKFQDNIIQISRTLQTCYNLSLGDKVAIRKGPTINNLQLVYIEKDNTVQRDDIPHWEWYLQNALSKCKCIVLTCFLLSPGKAEVLCERMPFENIELHGSKHSFSVESLVAESLLPSSSIGRFVPGKTRVQIVGNGISSRPDQDPNLTLSDPAIAGLDRQIQLLNRVFRAYECQRPQTSYLLDPAGILLYGPPGTGKSLLLNAIAKIGWGDTFTIDSASCKRSLADGASTIRRIFGQAKSGSKSVILVDRLDTLRNNEGFSELANLLGVELEAANKAASRILVVATATRLSNVEQSLRRAGRFDHEIEIPVPDSKARAAILKTLLGLPPDRPEGLLDKIAERTHGYVGADLHELVQKAGHEAEQRAESSADSTPITPDNIDSTPRPTEANFEVAFSQTAPTAMREIFLEAPNVRWTDIGGQDRVKQALREGVIWQFKVCFFFEWLALQANDSQYPTRMRELGIQPKKGLLLYGPPGCSKTLTAKALATEAGLNFLAVKGAELLNQYVGESERALREVFRRAKSASPSILFFDEIDAIASARVSGQSNGLQVLTTLLTEMDGFEALAGVTILAATNKPEALDPALMRPGRLDEILYVGPPDLKAREEILDITSAKMWFDGSVDFGKLAQQMDGFSGAEIVNICQRAGYQALLATDLNGYNGPILEKHLQDALSQVKPQITEEVRTRYEQWSAGREMKD